MADSKRGDRPASTVSPARPLRADAAANRARLLLVAAESFERGGLAVSLDEIARRAGVGPGTLHRHFPTKAALIDAALAERVRELAEAVEALSPADDPAEALVAALTLVTERGAESHALADRLRRESGDIDAAVAGPAGQLRVTLAGLLGRAQDAGGIRPDLDAGSLDALLAAGHALQVHPSGGDDLVQLLWDTLRTTPPASDRPGPIDPGRVDGR